jgi:type I restriction enzyme, S subunit
MAGEWSEQLLRDLLVTTKDGDWGKENPEEGLVPYHIIRGTDFPDVRVGDLSSVPLRYLSEHTVQRRTLEPDDILIETAGGTRDRPTGRTLLVTERVLARFAGPVTCASFARFLRIDRKQADPRFVFWYLQHLYDKGEMSQHQVQHTGVARFQYTRFAETQNIPLPPLAEQKAIATVLGALDDKIELNRRMNATLEAMARALFHSWFVDFDPVRAKLDGRKPEGLDKDTAALFPDALQASQLGPIPRGWEVARLDDIASVMMGLSPAGDSYNSDGQGVPLINGPVEFGDYFPVKTKWTQAATRFAAEDDLIFCVRGSTTGRRVVSDGDYGIGRGVCAIRSKGRFHSFLYQTINVDLERLLEKTTGSVFPSLSSPDIKGFPVLKPSGEVQQLYERTTKPLIQRIQQNHRQSRTLATLRDTLLPKLLSGELRTEGL